MKAITKIVSCDAAKELMSPFIDSMVTPEEAESLRSHLSQCNPCVRLLQSFISLRNLMAGIEPTPVPEDLQLDTRLKLSRERLPNDRDRWQARVDNILKPLAVPAVMGIGLTVMGFIVLMGSLLAPHSVQAQSVTMTPMIGAYYEPPRTTTPTVRRISRTMTPDLDQTLSVSTDVSDRGIVTDFTVISGSRSPGVDQWLQEMLLLAQFHPATSWGNPIPSRMIFSFVNVRG